METVAETKHQAVHASYCREMAGILRKLSRVPPHEVEKRGRLEFRLADIKNRLIPQLFNFSIVR